MSKKVIDSPSFPFFFLHTECNKRSENRAFMRLQPPHNANEGVAGWDPSGNEEERKRLIIRR